MSFSKVQDFFKDSDSDDEQDSTFSNMDRLGGLGGLGGLGESRSQKPQGFSGLGGLGGLGQQAPKTGMSGLGGLGGLSQQSNQQAPKSGMSGLGGLAGSGSRPGQNSGTSLGGLGGFGKASRSVSANKEADTSTQKKEHQNSMDMSQLTKVLYEISSNISKSNNEVVNSMNKVNNENIKTLKEMFDLIHGLANATHESFSHTVEALKSVSKGEKDNTPAQDIMDSMVSGIDRMISDSENDVFIIIPGRSKEILEGESAEAFLNEFKDKTVHVFGSIKEMGETAFAGNDDE